MTRDHDTKRAIRARMKVTGERYTVARSALIAPSAPTAAAASTEGGTVASSTIHDELDEVGFVVVRSFVTGDRLDRLIELVDEIVATIVAAKLEEENRRREAGETGFIDVWHGGEPGWVAEWVTDHPDVAWLLRHEQLGAFVTPTRIRAIASLPGFGHEGFHPNPHDGDACALALSGSRRDTGAFRAIPGSHRTPPRFEALGSAMAPHPEEVRVETDPGDLLVYDAALWKSATFNGGTEPVTCLGIDGQPR